MKDLDFIIENQDVLSDEMETILGGNYDQDSIRCESDGKVYCQDGPGTPIQDLCAFSIF